MYVETGLSRDLVELMRLERLAFAAKLRLSRAVLGWSQSELGFRIGLSQRAVHKIEQGDTEPRRSTVRAIEEIWRDEGIEFEDLNDGGFRVTVRSPVLDRPATLKARRERKTLRARVRVVHQNGSDSADSMVTVEKAIKGSLDEARAAGRSTGMDVAAVADGVELPGGFLKRRVGTLSGGERQRLALALALATRPEVLLLDEPLTALDQTTRHRLAGRLADRLAADGVGLLLASHDVRLVEQLTSTVHVLAEGTLVEHGPLGEVLANPQHPDTREFVEALPEATLRWS